MTPDEAFGNVSWLVGQALLIVAPAVLFFEFIVDRLRDMAGGL